VRTPGPPRSLRPVGAFAALTSSASKEKPPEDGGCSAGTGLAQAAGWEPQRPSNGVRAPKAARPRRHPRAGSTGRRGTGTWTGAWRSSSSSAWSRTRGAARERFMLEGGAHRAGCTTPGGARARHAARDISRPTDVRPHGDRQADRIRELAKYSPRRPRQAPGGHRARAGGRRARRLTRSGALLGPAVTWRPSCGARSPRRRRRTLRAGALLSTSCAPAGAPPAARPCRRRGGTGGVG